MKIKHSDIEISTDNPFANCKLGREKYAAILTSIVDSYADGFVLAVNNEWGAGKTTFIKMWEQSLKNKGFKTSYFNAWQNDFDSNPLIAILSEIKALTKSNDEGFKSLLKKGAVLTKSILPSLLEAVAGKYIKIKPITDAIKNTTEAATEILKDEIDEYAKKKKGLIEFRDELSKFISSHNNEKPFVFIIDELDRCRPNYAVEVLEYIKHFFSVPGIVFILSIDKIQLSNAIRGFYGSEKIDSGEYLRRFIDIEFSLPKPSSEDFCKYLYEYFEFDQFFMSTARIYHQEVQKDGETFLRFSIILFNKQALSLRQQEKVFAHARIVLNLFRTDNYIFPTVYLLLVYIRLFYYEFYKRMMERRLTPQELLDDLSKIISNSVDEENLRYLVYTEALLVHLYFNYYRELDHNVKLIDKAEGINANKLLIKSGIKYEGSDNLLLNFIEGFRTTEFYSTKLDYLLNTIDLTKSLIT